MQGRSPKPDLKIKSLGHVAVLSDDQIACADGETGCLIKIVNPDGTERFLAPEHNSKISYMRALENGDLVSVAESGQLRVWNVNEGKINKEYKLPKIQSIVVLGDGRVYFSTPNPQYTGNYFHLKTNWRKWLCGGFQYHEFDDLVKLMAVSPSGIVYCHGHSDIHKVKGTHNFCCPLSSPSSIEIVHHIKRMDGLTDNEILLSLIHDKEHKVVVWDFAQDKEVATLKVEPNDLNVTCAKILANGDLAIGYHNGVIAIWDKEYHPKSVTKMYDNQAINSIDEFKNGNVVCGSMGGIRELPHDPAPQKVLRIVH